MSDSCTAQRENMQNKGFRHLTSACADTEEGAGVRIHPENLPCSLMDIFIKCDAIKSRWLIVNIEG